MWRRVAWWIRTNVTCSIFMAANGRNRFYKNLGTCLPNHTVLHPRSPTKLHLLQETIFKHRHRIIILDYQQVQFVNTVANYPLLTQVKQFWIRCPAYLLLWLCILIVCLCTTTLTEVFKCFFLSFKATTRVKHAKTGHGPHSSQLLCCSMCFLCRSMYFCVVLCIACFVTFPVLFVYICVLNNCHRMATQLQLNTGCST